MKDTPINDGTQRVSAVDEAHRRISEIFVDPADTTIIKALSIVAIMIGRVADEIHDAAGQLAGIKDALIKR
jgi:hypothetical protein